VGEGQCRPGTVGALGAVHRQVADVLPGRCLGILAARCTAPQPTQAPARSSSQLVPLVVGVGALALLGASLGFDLWGDSTYSDAKAEMTSQARRDSLYNSANDKRYAAEGLVVAGAATAGIAIWLYLRHSDDERSAATASRLVVTSNGLAIAGGF